MWGNLLRNAAALASESAQNIVGNLDEIASKASTLLETLDQGIGNENEIENDENIGTEDSHKRSSGNSDGDEVSDQDLNANRGRKAIESNLHQLIQAEDENAPTNVLNSSTIAEVETDHEVSHNPESWDTVSDIASIQSQVGDIKEKHEKLLRSASVLDAENQKIYLDLAAQQRAMVDKYKKKREECKKLEQQLNVAHSLCSDTESQLKVTTDQLQKLLEQNGHLSTYVAELESQREDVFSQMQLQREQNRREVELLKNEKHDILRWLETMEGTLPDDGTASFSEDDLLDKLNSPDNELRDLAERLVYKFMASALKAEKAESELKGLSENKFESELSSFHKKVSKLEEQILSLSKENESLQNDLTIARRQVEEHSQQQLAAKESLKEDKDEILRLEEEIGSLQTEQRMIQEAFDSKVEDYELTIAELRQAVADADERVQQVEEEMLQLREESNSKLQQIEQSKEEESEFQSMHSENKVSTLTDEVDILKAELRMMETENRGLKAQLDSFHLEKLAHEKELGNRNSSIQHLEDELVRAKEIQHKLMEELGDLGKQKDHAQHQLQDSLDTIANVVDGAEKAKEKCMALEDENVRLEERMSTEINSKNAELIALGEQIIQLKAQLTASNEGNALHEQRILELEDEARKAQAQLSPREHSDEKQPSGFAEQLEELNSTLAIFNEVNSSQQRRISELEEEVRATQEQLSQSSSTDEEVTARLNATIVELEEKIVVLQEEREVHVEKVLYLQEELRKAQIALQEVAEKATGADKAEEFDGSARESELEEQITEARNRIVSLESRIAEQQESLDLSAKKIAQQEEENCQLEENLETFRMNTEAQLRDSESILESSRVKNERLQLELSEAMGLVEDQRQQITLLEHEKKTMTIENFNSASSLTETFEQLQRENDSLRIERNELITKLQDIKSALDSLQEEYETLQKTYDSAVEEHSREVDQLASSNSNYQAEFVMLQQRIADSSALTIDLSKKISENEMELQELNVQVGGLTSTLATANEVNSSQQRRISELEEEVRATQEQLSQSSSTDEEVTARLNATIVELEEKIVVLQEEREVHVEKVLYLQEELRKAQGLLASKDDEIDSLRVAAENFESLKSNYDALKQATQHQQTLHNEEVAQLQLQLQAADEKASLLDVELNKVKEMLVDTQEMYQKENTMAIHVKEIEITALSEEIQALQDRLRTQEVSLMQHASQELQAKSQELEQLHLQFQALQQELQAVRQEADARAQQKHVLDTAYGESQMKLGVLEQENLRISKSLTEAQDALGSLRDTYDALTSGELPALHNANATLTEEITYLQQEQRRWVQENEHFRTRMSTLEQQAQVAQREAQQAQQKLQQASSWEARAIQAEDQLKKLETKKKKDLEMLKKQNEKISLLQQELHQLKEQQPSTKPMVVSASESAGTGHSFSEADWKTREEEFRQSQEALQEEIANLKQEYLAKMDQYQSLERQLAQVEEENVQLHGELEARKQEFQFLSEDVAEWKAKAAALIQEQNTSEDIRMGQQQQQQQQQQAQDQSATTLRMLQAQMHELQVAAKTAEEQHQQVLQDVQQRTQSTIADLHKQLSHWKRENMRLGEDVHRLEQQLSVVQSQKADESILLPSVTGNILGEDDLARDMETGYVSTADSGNSLTSSGSRAKMSGHQSNSAFHTNQLNRMEAKTLVDMQHGTTLLVLADDKKDLAGLHPWLVQCWATLRQRCAAYPWALAILGDRPPRLSASAQVALVYFLFLQFYVFYLRSFGCVREATGVAESVA